MPIEIKELRINIQVDELPKNIGTHEVQAVDKTFQKMKNQIIEECTQKVMKKIKKQSER